MTEAPNLTLFSLTFTKLIQVSFPYTGETRTGHSTPGRSHQSWERGTINSLGLLAVLILMQLRTLLAFLVTEAHCWLMFNFSFTSNIRSFSENMLSRLFVPSLCQTIGYSSTSTGIPLFFSFFVFFFFFNNFIPLCLFVQLVKVSLIGSTTIWCIKHPFQFCVIYTLAKGALGTIIKVINEGSTILLILSNIIH